MPAMSTQALKALLQAEKADSLGTDTASQLVKERTQAMEYYLGQMDDLQAPSDRSQAVSSDVADTVEGLMPSLMEIFASGDDVMSFEPVGPEDEDAADQETAYVNHVFWNKNPGFSVLYTFIKDALLQKNGIVKVAWEEGETDEEETYSNVEPQVYAVMAQTAEEAGFEISEQTENEDGTYDLTIKRTKKYGCAEVMNVPPEEFGITKRARSIRSCDYCYHQVRVTESDLIEQGYDAEQVKSLGTAGSVEHEEELARNTVEDDMPAGAGENDATRLVWKTEHYVKCDYDGSGKARLWRVATGGDDAEVLTKGGKPDVVKVDLLPFAAMTPVPMPHRFFGRSTADLVMDIQRIKTFLTRGYIDQLALTINPPVEVAEALSHDKTLDDLLINRPGKIVRTRQPGAITYHRPDSRGTEVLPAIEYFDATREWRTGVTRQGQGIDAKALADQSATAAQQMFSMAQARMRLVARIFAETGIKDLFLLLHATIRKNDRASNTARLRGRWVEVNPREWKTREDLTVTVGISGSKEQQTAFLINLLGIQRGMLEAGKAHMVQDKNIYSTVKKLVEFSGLKSVEPYFSDPEEMTQDPETGEEVPANPPPEPQPDPAIQVARIKGEIDMQKVQMDGQFKAQELELKAQIEKVQAEMDAAVKDREVTAQIALEEKKFELERELKLMEAGIKREQMQADLQMKQADHQLKEREMGAQMHMKEREMQASHSFKEKEMETKAAAEGLKKHKTDNGDEYLSKEEDRARRMDKMMETMAEALKRRKGVKIVRGADGRPSHTEDIYD
jgi:hypothetical protein